MHPQYSHLNDVATYLSCSFAIANVGQGFEVPSESRTWEFESYVGSAKAEFDICCQDDTDFPAVS